MLSRWTRLAAVALVALLFAPAALASIPSAADLALAPPALPELAPASIEANREPESCGIFCQRLDVHLEAGLFGGGGPELLALDAWGNYRNPSELEASKNRFGFTGHLFDRETGTYYARARYFDPGLGRFLSQDTFGGFEDEPTSLHGYTYVENRPTYFIDPDGQVAVVDNVVGGVVSVGIGYAATCFFKGCDQYSWADAGVDFGLGFASSGLSSLKYLKYAKDASKAVNAARLAGRAGAQYGVSLAAEVARHEIKEEEYSLAEVSEGAVLGAIFGEVAGAAGRGVGRGGRLAAQRLAQSESRAAQFLARDLTSFSAVQGAQAFGRGIYQAGQDFVTDIVSPGSRGWAGQRGMTLNSLLVDAYTLGHADDLEAIAARLRGASNATPLGRLTSRTMTRAEWTSTAQAYRTARGQAQAWRSRYSQIWQEIAEEQLALPASQRSYSMANLIRMERGRAARIRVVMQSRKDTSKVVTRAIPLELNHRFLPQRSGSPLAHERWNVDVVHRWGHEAVDPYRHAGWDLIKILEGPGTFR